MEYICGYCKKVLVTPNDKVYITQVGKDYFVPYCSKKHRDLDDLSDKLLIRADKVNK